MARRLRKSLLACLLVFALICTAVATLLFTRPVAADPNPGDWDGDLIAAGWGAKDGESVDKPNGYAITWVNKNDIDENGLLKSGVVGSDSATNGKIAYITIGSADALAYFAHEVYADRLYGEAPEEKEEAEDSVEKVDEGTTGEVAPYHLKHDLDGAYVKLTIDIDLKGNMWIPIGQTAEPSGAPEHRFSGTFDASYIENGVKKNHVISNLATAELCDLITPRDDGSYYIDYENADGKKAEIPFTFSNASIKIVTGVKNGTEQTKYISHKSYNYGLFGVTQNIEVKNLTVDGVNIKIGDHKNIEANVSVASVGTIIGYNVGGLTMKNCVAGSPETEDLISVVGALEVEHGGALINESVGGVVGRCWGYDEVGSYASQYRNSYHDINLDHCTNYVNIEYADEDGNPLSHNEAKFGGIIGHQTFFINYVVDSCVNFGDIKGGGHVGGIASFFSFAMMAAAEGDPEFKYEIKNCDNYGHLESYNYVVDDDGNKANGHTARIGGIVAEVWGREDKNYDTQVKINLNGCNNYGNLSSDGSIGGIISYAIDSSANEISFTNIYNYGKLYQHGSGNTGGCIGQFTINSGKITVSGGNIGSVYGLQNNSTVSGICGSAFKSNVETPFLVDIGEVIIVESAEKLPEMSKEHSEYVEHEDYDDTHSELNDGVFVYANKGATIIGLSDDLLAPGSKFDGSLTVPASVGGVKVTKIAAAAFAGQSKITSVVFAAGSNIAEIGDFAFSGTSLTSINLPAKLYKIGAGAFSDLHSVKVPVVKDPVENAESEEEAGEGETVEVWLNSITFPSALREVGRAAFANNKYLNHVVLSQYAEEIEFGRDAFKGTRVNNSGSAQGAFLIAQNHKQYGQADKNDSFAISGGFLTYVVTIEYYYNNNPVMEGEGENAKAYKETRLHGQDYTTYLNDQGQWVGGGKVTVGPASSDEVSYIWYYNNVRINGISSVNALLSGVSGDIKLEAFGDGSGQSKEIIVREDIVYDGTDYTSRVNDLLSASSDKFESIIETVIYKNGEKVKSIKDAGTYTLQVKDNSGTVYEFEVTIARAELDLSNLENLEWFISEIKIGETVRSTKTSLMSYPLYIYTYGAGAVDGNGESLAGQEYPSYEILDTAQIEALHLIGSYQVRSVEYSAVRNRNGQVTIAIDTEGKGYSADAYTGNSATDVGRYLASTVLTADVNHVFTLGKISSLRGLDIKLTGDHTTANVQKIWYIIELSNWLVNANKGDFSIPNHVFGDTRFSVAAPQTYYTGVGGTMTMHLSLDGQPIGDASGFGYSDWSLYINSAMPAGNYTLEIIVDGITEAVQDPDAPNDPNKTVEIFHKGFSETYTFTVEKGVLPSPEAVNNVLKNKQFESSVTDNRTLYSPAAQTIVNYYLTNTATVDRSNTYWANHDEYYLTDGSVYYIEFNLLRDYSDTYKAAADLDTSKPDTYHVYYRISAKNYYNSTEKLSGKETRYDYFFKLVKYSIVDLPVVEDKTESGDYIYKYTGYEVLPKLAGSDLYEIIWSDSEYITGRAHYIKFKMNEPLYYRWNGVTGDTVEIEFVIDKAENDFTISLNMLGWNYKTFDAEVNNIRAAVKFLDKDEIIHFSVNAKDSSVAYAGLEDFAIYENGQVSPEIAAILKELPTGDYILYARVNGTNNYLVLNDNVPFTVSKGVNSWKDGEEDLVLPNWIEGRYDPDENPIVINAEHGTVNFKIINFDTEEVYYNSTVDAADALVDKLNELDVGKYMLIVWVDETENYYGLVDRTFMIQVFERPGLPWWAVILIVVGALGIAALVIFILWKKGVFQIVTDKIMLAIRTRVSVESTIASVRAAKMMEEGRKSIADAKRRERLEAAREKQRSMTPEERAAQLEAKAQADAARAEKLRARSASDLAKAEKMRQVNPAEEKDSSNAKDEAAASETPDNPTEE